MTTAETLFTEADRARIAEAVRTAEARTAGEIVPYIVGRSDRYPEAPMRAGAAGAFLVLTAAAAIEAWRGSWHSVDPLLLAVLAVAAFLLCALLAAKLPAFLRLFVHPASLQQRVDDRAAQAFLSEEVFQTRERTGILLFVSLLERRVRVMGDAGINAKVKQEQWDGIVHTIVQGMKSGAAADGLVTAIGMCGGLLTGAGVEIRSDDSNELSDAARIRNR